jgi:hypothetical protein
MRRDPAEELAADLGGELLQLRAGLAGRVEVADRKGISTAAPSRPTRR